MAYGNYFPVTYQPNYYGQPNPYYQQMQNQAMMQQNQQMQNAQQQSQQMQQPTIQQTRQSKRHGTIPLRPVTASLLRTKTRHTAM